MRRSSTRRLARAVPIWTPDGSRLTSSPASGEPRSGDRGRSADGSGPPRAELPTAGHQRRADLVARRTRARLSGLASTSADVWISALARRPQAATPLADRRPSTMLAATFSPDGRWLAYVVRRYRARRGLRPRRSRPGRGAVQVSTDGGTQPHWSRDGKELFYRSGTGVDGGGGGRPPARRGRGRGSLGRHCARRDPQASCDVGAACQTTTSPPTDVVSRLHAARRRQRSRMHVPCWSASARQLAAPSCSPAGTRVGPLRDQRPTRRGWDGRGLPRHGHEARTRGRAQAAAPGLCVRPRATGPLRPRGQAPRFAQPSGHRAALWLRDGDPRRRHHGPRDRDGAGRRAKTWRSG